MAGAMRLYGRRFAKRLIDKRINQTTETRDAVLWDIDELNYKCRVKIQGSSEYILAHYPRNWKSKPYWLKPGNAVRILHRSGVRGYVEVIGEGRAIPLPVEGSALPPTPSLPNMIIWGLELFASSPETMGVIITEGSFRINGTVYYFSGELIGGAIIMDDPAPMTMGAGVTIVMMGRAQYTAMLDPAPDVGYYRYDAFCIGEDGVIDYLKGTASKTYPVKPTIPSNHLIIGSYIFVRGEATVIYDSDIGAEWTVLTPTTIEIETPYNSTESPFPWNIYNDYPTCNVKCTVKDQYGVPFPMFIEGFLIILTKNLGLGDLYSSTSGWNNDEVQQLCYSTYTFTYRRDQTVSEIPTVTLTAALDGFPGVFGYGLIHLGFSEV